MLFYDCKCYEITTVKITYTELVLVTLESNYFKYKQFLYEDHLYQKIFIYLRSYMNDHFRASS